MNAIRKIGKNGKATIEIAFDDGTTAKLGGARAMRAVAVVVFRLGELVNDSWAARRSGWYVEGCRRTVYAAHSLANSIRKSGGECCGHRLEDVKVLVVNTQEACNASTK